MDVKGIKVGICHGIYQKMYIKYYDENKEYG